MVLIFRGALVAIKALFKSKLTLDKPDNYLDMRVYPNDLDFNLHMNNGRYLSVCDLSRLDLFVRTGIYKHMIKNKWMPVVGEHTMIYKRPLKPFQKYRLTMTLDKYDNKFFYFKHQFIVDGKVVAEGTSKGALKSKNGVIDPIEILKLTGNL